MSCKTVVSSEINLMEDFVEMEKLALVPLQTGLNGNALEPEVMCKEMVLVPDSRCNQGMLNNEMKSRVPGRLQ
ncbi:hypothetical protein V6N13_043974 [Hibiscus sabdariffa]